MKEIVELFNRIQRDVSLLGQMLGQLQISQVTSGNQSTLPPPLAPSPKPAPRQPLPPPPQVHSGPKKYKRQLTLQAPLRIGDSFDWLGDRYRVKSFGVGMLTASKLDAAGNLSAGRPFEFGVQLPADPEEDESNEVPFQVPPPGQPWVDNRPIAERKAVKVSESEKSLAFDESGEVEDEEDEFVDTEVEDEEEDFVDTEVEDEEEEEISDEETFHYDEDVEADDLDDDTFES